MEDLGDDKDRVMFDLIDAFGMEDEEKIDKLVETAKSKGANLGIVEMRVPLKMPIEPGHAGT